MLPVYAFIAFEELWQSGKLDNKDKEVAALFEM